MEKPERTDIGLWLAIAIAVLLIDAGLITGAVLLTKGDASASSPTPGIRPTVTPPPATGRRASTAPRGSPAAPGGQIIDSVGNTIRVIGGTPAGGLTANSMVDSQGVIATSGTPASSGHTYPWQLDRNQPGLLDSVPPQVKIIPTEITAGGWSTRSGDRAIGVNQTPEQMIAIAYSVPIAERTRIQFPPNMPTQRYDYIANLPNGALEALQTEMKDKVGLVANRETRDSTILLLKVDHPDAPGLKPGVAVASRGGSATSGPSTTTTYHNARISLLVSLLGRATGLTVRDETGLTGNYDMEFPTIRATPRGQTFDRYDEVRKTLLDNLGLDLVKTNGPVEQLVVKKVK